MVSMRRALNEAALLVSIVPLSEGATRAWSQQLTHHWEAELDSGEVTALWGDGWLCWVSRWSTGKQARESWGRFVGSSSWRETVTWVTQQPTVALLVEQGVAWPQVAEGSRWALACVTRDATVQTRQDRRRGERPRMSLPERDMLPQVSPGALWPVLGHPGRLMVVVPEDALDVSLEVLEKDWGPWVDPVLSWRGGTLLAR